MNPRCCAPCCSVLRKMAPWMSSCPLEVLRHLIGQKSNHWRKICLLPWMMRPSAALWAQIARTRTMVRPSSFRVRLWQLLERSLWQKKARWRLTLQRWRCPLTSRALKIGVPPSWPKARWHLNRCRMRSWPRLQRQMSSAICAGWWRMSSPRICRNIRISLTISMSRSMVRLLGLLDSTGSARPADQSMDGAKICERCDEYK